IDQELKVTQLLELSIEHQYKNKIYEQENILKSIIYEEDIKELNEDVQSIFEHLQIPLAINRPAILVLSHISLNSEFNLKQKKEHIDSLSFLWNAYMSNQFTYVMLKTDKNELVWLLQSVQPNVLARTMTTLIEGNLELIQAALMEKHACHISFTIS